MVPPKFSAGRAPFVAPLARGTGRGRLRPCSAAVFASSLPWDASSLRRPSLSGGVVGTCAASTQCPQLYQFKGKCQEPGKQRARARASGRGDILRNVSAPSRQILGSPAGQRPAGERTSKEADRVFVIPGGNGVLRTLRGHVPPGCPPPLSEGVLLYGSPGYFPCAECFGADAFRSRSPGGYFQ